MAEEKNVEAVETKETSVKDEVATKIQKQIQKKREKKTGWQGDACPQSGKSRLWFQGC